MGTSGWENTAHRSRARGVSLAEGQRMIGLPLRTTNQVERSASAEPLQLSQGKGMRQRECLLGPIRMPDQTFHRLAWRQLCQPDQANPVIFPDPLVIGRILKRQSQQPLLLEVRFMNASETSCNDRDTAQQPRR